MPRGIALEGLFDGVSQKLSGNLCFTQWKSHFQLKLQDGRGISFQSIPLKIPEIARAGREFLFVKKRGISFHIRERQVKGLEPQIAFDNMA